MPRLLKCQMPSPTNFEIGANPEYARFFVIFKSKVNFLHFSTKMSNFGPMAYGLRYNVMKYSLGRVLT